MSDCNNRKSSNQNINIVISETALSGIAFKESIDLALVCAAFDQKVNLIFVEQGVCNLIKSQNYNDLKDKNHLEILKGLEYYEVENIVAEKESLENYSINNEDLIEQCEILSMENIKKLHMHSHTLVSF